MIKCFTDYPAVSEETQRPLLTAISNDYQIPSPQLQELACQTRVILACTEDACPLRYGEVVQE